MSARRVFGAFYSPAHLAIDRRLLETLQACRRFEGVQRSFPWPTTRTHAGSS